MTTGSLTARSGFLALVLAITGMGLNTLNAPLLLDDVDQLSHVRSLRSLPALLGPDCYGFLRPVKNLAFKAISLTGAGAAVAAHVLSLALVLLAATLTFLLLARVLPRRGWAAAATAVWALSPTNVSCLAWPSCLNIAASACGMLAALRVWDAATRPIGLRAAVLILLCFLVSLLSYENAVAFPVLLVLWRWIRFRNLPARGHEVLVPILCALIAAVFVLARLARGAATSIPNENFGPASHLVVALSSARFTMDHFLTWLWPWGRLGFNGTYTWHGSAGEKFALAAAWLGVLGIAGAAWTLRARRPIESLGLFWFLVAFLPTSNLVPLRNTPFADYYLFLPGLGLALALTETVRRLTEAAPAGPGRVARRALAAVLVGSRLAGIAVSISWSGAWKSEAELFRRTLAARPDTFTAMAGLARCRLLAGDLAEARALARAAVEQAPWYGHGYFVLGSVHLQEGRWEEALPVFRRAA